MQGTRGERRQVMIRSKVLVTCGYRTEVEGKREVGERLKVRVYTRDCVLCRRSCTTPEGHQLKTRNGHTTPHEMVECDGVVLNEVEDYELKRRVIVQRLAIRRIEYDELKMLSDKKWEVYKEGKKVAQVLLHGARADELKSELPTIFVKL